MDSPLGDISPGQGGSPLILEFLQRKPQIWAALVRWGFAGGELDDLWFFNHQTWCLHGFLTMKYHDGDIIDKWWLNGLGFAKHGLFDVPIGTSTKWLGNSFGQMFYVAPQQIHVVVLLFWGDFTQDKGVESMLGLYICIWTKHGRHRAHQWIPMMDFNTKGLMPGLSRAWGWGQNVFFVQKRRIYPKYPKLSKARWLIGKS